MPSLPERQRVEIIDPRIVERPHQTTCPRPLIEGIFAIHREMVTGEERERLGREGEIFPGQSQRQEPHYLFDHNLVAKKLQQQMLEVERVRLKEQTEVYGFGEAHIRFHEKLGRRLHPKRIAVIGTDPFGLQIDALLKTPGYEGAEISVFEATQEKIDGAMQALAGKSDRVRPVPGNVIETLPKEGLFDLIDVKLLLQHPPAFVRRLMTKTFEAALSEGGLVAAGDLIDYGWGAQVTPGYENDESAVSEATVMNLFIHGGIKEDGSEFRGALYWGWKDRTAGAWRDEQETVDAVLEGTNLELLAGTRYTAKFPPSESDGSGADVYASLVPVIIMGFEGNLGRQRASLSAEDLRIKEQAARDLWTYGERYVIASHHEGVQTLGCNMFFAAYKKKAA